MSDPDCQWCQAPADVIDNYDTLRCWECWDDSGRHQPHNLVIAVLHHRNQPPANANGQRPR
jgi:hypothetical protein